jgi:hypothetical protein
MAMKLCKEYRMRISVLNELSDGLLSFGCPLSLLDVCVFLLLLSLTDSL